MKICYVGWGDHVHLERWAGYFAQMGNQVQVISHSGIGVYPAGVRQFPIGLGNRGPELKRLRLRWLLWRLRPDIVHVHYAGFSPDVLNMWRGPVVVTVWGSDVYRLEDKPARARDRVLSALGKAACVTCDSQDLQNRILDLWPQLAGRVHIIQWGVDTTRFTPQAKTGALLRSWDAAGQRLIYSPRNFDPLYNLSTIVRAFRLVHRAEPATRLLLKSNRGSESYRAQVLQEVTEFGLGGAVKVIDSIPYEQMPELYAEAIASVSVPYSDGTPMSLLEAMACGSVPIFSDLPSVREWVSHGVNGFLVAPEDHEALAAHLIHLIRNPDVVARIVSMNRALVEERASQRVHMERMATIYRSLVGSVPIR